MIIVMMCQIPLLALANDLVCPPPSGEITTEQAYDMVALAGWSPEYWEEAVSVMYCECRFDLDREGDGGLAVGPFQIHPLWEGWAEERGYTLSRRVPLENAALAWLIFSEYDRYRWRQWTCQPYWVFPPTAS